jgi:putative transposase
MQDRSPVATHGQVFRLCTSQAEESGMEPQTIRKTFQYKVKPTAVQERTLDRTLMLCRHVYNAAPEERRAAWQKCGVSVSYYEQKAKLPCIKAELPEYREVQRQVLQGVVQQVDRAFQGCFQRVQAGHTPGYPRFMLT